MNVTFDGKTATITTDDIDQLGLIWFVLLDMSNCTNYSEEDSQSLIAAANAIETGLAPHIDVNKDTRFTPLGWQQ